MKMEVPVGIAPTYGGFADPCLTPWLRHQIIEKTAVWQNPTTYNLLPTTYAPTPPTGTSLRPISDAPASPGRAPAREGALRSPCNRPSAPPCSAGKTASPALPGWAGRRTCASEPFRHPPSHRAHRGERT